MTIKKQCYMLNFWDLVDYVDAKRRKQEMATKRLRSRLDRIEEVRLRPIDIPDDEQEEIRKFTSAGSFKWRGRGKKEE